MKVIVIAAGDSKRLGEHTKNIPKAMVKIDDRRILDFQIDFFKKEKVNEIIIVTGKNHEIFNLCSNHPIKLKSVISFLIMNMVQ